MANVLTATNIAEARAAFLAQLPDGLDLNSDRERWRRYIRDALRRDLPNAELDALVAAAVLLGAAFMPTDDDSFWQLVFVVRDMQRERRRIRKELGL